MSDFSGGVINPPLGVAKLLRVSSPPGAVSGYPHGIAHELPIFGQAAWFSWVLVCGHGVILRWSNYVARVSQNRVFAQKSRPGGVVPGGNPFAPSSRKVQRQPTRIEAGWVWWVDRVREYE